MAKIELDTSNLSTADKDQIASALKNLNNYSKETKESLSTKGQDVVLKLSHAIRSDIDMEIN